MRDLRVHERGSLTRDCGECPDRALCDIIDSGDIEFWPEEHRLEEVSRRFGKSVSQLEYERVRECLLEGSWVPVERGRRGSVTATRGRILGERAAASSWSTTNRPSAKSDTNAVIIHLPSALRKRLGDDGAQALVELLRNTVRADEAGESPAQDIRRDIDHAFTLLEFKMKAFIVTVTLLSVSFLTLLVVALQVGKAMGKGT